MLFHSLSFSAHCKRKLSWFLLLSFLSFIWVWFLLCIFELCISRQCGFELHRSGALILGFFSWPMCVARYVYDWIFLAVLYPALNRTWNVKNFHWSQLSVIFLDPWAQVLPGDSVCSSGGVQVLSVTRLKADEDLVLFSPHWLDFNLISFKLTF